VFIDSFIQNTPNWFRIKINKFELKLFNYFYPDKIKIQFFKHCVLGRH